MYKVTSILLAVLIAMVMTIVTGCSSNGGVENEVHVSIDQALKMWKNEEAIIIDVRTPQEYKAGHIPGVTNIQLSELESRSSEVPKDKKVLLICRSGNRSSQGTSLLRSKGFGNVYNITEGMSSWRGPVK
ncbi:MAG: sulfurtransferase [Firmicutes bacterium]|nr:sulfurtransferase [Bacillota bacterium]